MRTLRSKVVAGATIALASLLGTPTVAGADVAPPAEVRSNFENYYGARLERDCGFSEPVPGVTGQSFWLFCDTAVYDWAGNLSNFIDGTTAARGPATRGLVPQGLTEVTTPPAALPTIPSNIGPSRFLPVPTGVLSDSGGACANRYDGDGDLIEGMYPASWASGMATIPSTSRYLITYRDVCVQTPRDAEGRVTSWVFAIKRFGMVEYTPSTNTLSNDVKVFSASGANEIPVQQQLVSPVFSGTYLYLFGSVCSSNPGGTCQAGSVYQARVTASSRTTGSAYRWRYGTQAAQQWGTWSQAASIVSGAAPLEIHVDDYGAVGRGIAFVEQRSIDGTYRIWRASSPTAAFTSTPNRVLPGCTAPGVQDLCRAAFGHPDLSTTSNALISYFAVDGQRIKMIASPW